MPVTDLREYLQLPQAAPQNPGFQRTRQLAGMPTEPFQSALAFERAAPGIRANQGMAYLQEIQNHQNEIAQQAQNIRIQQEAQLAAEQATQGLAGANPQSTGWLPQRQQILQQNPNAMLDPRFQNALRIYDQGYSQFDHQRQLQQRQIDAENKQLQGLMLRGMEYGGDEEKLTKFAQTRDLGGMAQVVGEARRANLGKSKTGKDKIDYRTKGLFDKYASALAGGNPEEAKAISDYAREQGLHWENPVAQDASGSAVMAPPANQSVVPGMGGATATQPEIPPQHYIDEVKGVSLDNPRSAQLLSEYASSPSLPLEARREAVKKLGEAAASPPPFKGMDAAQEREAKRALIDAHTMAKANLEGDEISQKYVAPAWTRAKSEMEQLVDQFAQKNGFSAESVYRSIAGRKRIPVVNAQGAEVDEAPGALILGDTYASENPHLKQVADQIAKMHNRQSPIFARIHRFLGGENIINGDVLFELAKEKVGVPAAQSVALPAANPALETALQKYAPK